MYYPQNRVLQPYEVTDTLREFLRIFELPGWAIAHPFHPGGPAITLRLPNPCPADAAWWIARALGMAQWDGTPSAYTGTTQTFILQPLNTP